MASPSYGAAWVGGGQLYTVAFAPPSVYPAMSLDTPGHRIDVEHGGVHRIVGTVKEKGTPDQPLSRLVGLFRMRDKIFIRETWSAPDGSYVFDWIDGAEKYFTVAFDHLGNYRAVIADNLVPEPMP